MIAHSEQDGKLSFTVRVVPRACRGEIVGEHNGALRVRVTAPPVEGGANEELIRLLARSFGVPRSAVEISAGSLSRVKQVTVLGANQNDLARLIS